MSAWTEVDLLAHGLKIREPLVRVVTLPVDVVRLELPLSPSVNSAWTNIPGKGRVRSSGYRRWHKQAFDEMMLQKPGHIAGRICVVINAGRIRRRCDIDNRIKPALDLLSGVVTDDDCFVERVSAGWSDDVVSDRMVIEVRKAT